jgi:site-specific DNA-cytosine methylase
VRDKLVWLDLCSGLGGASQPALDRGWRVIRVDIDLRFKPDIVADVRNLPLKPFHVDVLWASPPCTEFTKTSLPASWAQYRYDGWLPTAESIAHSIELVKACRSFADEMVAPWIIENVRGARKWLTPLLGPVRAMTSGHVFWSNMPLLIPPGLNGRKWLIAPTKDPRDRAAMRAKIPYEIGEAICRAVEARNEA